VTRRVRAIFLGSGRFGVEPLWWLVGDENIELVGVVTAPPRASGRGGRLTATPVDVAADELGVRRIVRVERLRAPYAIAQVLSLKPELAVLADFGQIVPKPLLDLPYGALNLHPSLLPRHRGATPIPATILAGDNETGVTLIRMDGGIDTGPIVAQTRRPLTGTETAPELEELLEIEADDLLRRNLGPWLQGEIEPRPQPEQGATMTRMLRREDGRLDPNQPAEVLERQVRAYQPWPGSFIDTDGGRFVVWRARVASTVSAAPPGTLVRVESAGLGLVTAERILELLDVQPAGGRRMSGADLLRGRPALAGARVRPVAPTASSGQ
jgi:methionyl-tRNA formyltransferase